MSVLQAISSIASLFIAYRLVINFHGQSTLGLWSLLTAFTVSIRMLDPSGGGAVSRFVAKAMTDPEKVSVARLIDTAMLIQLGLYAGLSLAAFFPILWIVSMQVSFNDAIGAQSLILWLLIVLILSVAAIATTDAFDGLKRSDIRAAMMIVGNFVLVILSVVFVPKNGLAGLAAAQAGQFIVVIIGARFLLSRRVEALSIFPRHFSGAEARNIVGYGVKLQVAGVANYLTDPLCRILLNHVGGLSALGIYELASKLVTQSRLLLSSATSPLIPIFSTTHALTDKEILPLVQRGNTALVAITLLMTASSIAAAPVLSIIMLGEIDFTLVIFTSLLAVGYGLNASALLIYLHAQATGRLKWNIVGQFLIGVTTLSGTWLMQSWFGIFSIPLAFAAGLSMAAVVFIHFNLRDGQISFAEVMPQRAQLLLLLHGSAALAIGFLAVDYIGFLG